MYKSPIELLITDIQHQVTEKCEEACYEAVLHYVPNVDRVELLKALEYDRGQYEKGYRDAINELPRCRDCASRVHDKASDEYWCDNPGGLGCRLKDEYFCPFWERRFE